jgi:hypothetical protein
MLSIPVATSCPGKGFSTTPSLKERALAPDRPRLFKYSTALSCPFRAALYRAVASSKKLLRAFTGTTEVTASLFPTDYVV